MSEEGGIGLALAERFFGLILIIAGALVGYFTFTSTQTLGAFVGLFAFLFVLLLVLGLVLMTAKIE